MILFRIYSIERACSVSATANMRTWRRLPRIMIIWIRIRWKSSKDESNRRSGTYFWSEGTAIRCELVVVLTFTRIALDADAGRITMNIRAAIRGKAASNTDEVLIGHEFMDWTRNRNKLCAQCTIQ